MYLMRWPFIRILKGCNFWSDGMIPYHYHSSKSLEIMMLTWEMLTRRRPRWSPHSTGFREHLKLNILHDRWVGNAHDRYLTPPPPSRTTHFERSLFCLSAEWRQISNARVFFWNEILVLRPSWMGALIETYITSTNFWEGSGFHPSPTGIVFRKTLWTPL